MKTISTTIHETETYTLTFKPTIYDRLEQSATRHVYDPKDPGRDERAFQERIKKLSQGIQK